MEALTYKIEAYEGPLDVLLTLIRKNEINIYDIPIAELLRQFIEHIDVMRRENLEVSSEFLTMAAALVQIKSAMLLPKHDEDAEDPRAELVNLLLEYERYKQAAEAFREHESGVYRFVREPMKLEVDTTYNRTHSVYELRAAYDSIATAVTQKRERRVSPETISRVVLRKSTSIVSKIYSILRGLARKTRVAFLSLIGRDDPRGDAVASFIAALQLAREGRVHIENDGASLSLTMTREARKKLKHKIK
ncbi:MAG: segregation/condensation protein A [Clostridia bacterium]|nr:segregation/condensation protein A [Clostridia bacterium]MBR5768690.1 segregation/condensation protein A [Clostridia bacterium]MBR5942117.1 segregation/condensation protein A [Clostridia bacterium]